MSSSSSSQEMAIELPDFLDAGRTSPILTAQFAKAPQYGHWVAAGSEKGEVFLIDTTVPTELKRKGTQLTTLLLQRRQCLTMPDLLSATCRNFQAHQNAIFDLSWSSSGKELATACGDRTVRLFDVQRLTLKAAFEGHAMTVKTVEMHPVREVVSSEYVMCLPYRHRHCYRLCGFVLFEISCFSARFVLLVFYFSHDGSFPFISLFPLKWGADIFVSGGREGCAILWDTRARPSRQAVVEFVSSSSRRPQTLQVDEVPHRATRHILCDLMSPYRFANTAPMVRVQFVSMFKFLSLYAQSSHSA